MTLINTTFLRVLHNEAVPKYEHAPMSFWTYFFNLHFSEECFLYDREKPANEKLDPLRRVDAQLRYLETSTNAVQVLFFHEAKNNGAAQAKLVEVENQVYEACGIYCHEAKYSHVYAVTTIGTAARVWKYVKADGTLQPLTGSEGTGVRSAYIEVDSPDASKISAAVQHMKNFPPSSFSATLPTTTYGYVKLRGSLVTLLM